MIFPILASSVFFGAVQAQDLNTKIMDQINAGKTGAGYSDAVDPQVTIASVIKIFLGFVGSIFIVLVAMASYWFITARGREEKVEKAMSTLRRAIIGLFVVVLAYAITSFVTSGVQDALEKPTPSENFDCLEGDPTCWEEFAG